MANFDLSLKLSLLDIQSFQAGLSKAIAGLNNIRSAISKGVGSVNLGGAITGNLSNAIENQTKKVVAALDVLRNAIGKGVGTVNLSNVISGNINTDIIGKGQQVAAGLNALRNAVDKGGLVSINLSRIVTGTIPATLAADVKILASGLNSIRLAIAKGVGSIDLSSIIKGNIDAALTNKIKQLTVAIHGLRLVTNKSAGSISLGNFGTAIATQANAALAAINKLRATAGKGIGNINTGSFTGGMQAVEKQSNSTGLSLGTLAKRFIYLAGVIGAGKMFYEFVQSGIALNRTIETSRIGIAALVVSQSELSDATGRVLKGTEALDAGAVIAADQLQKLRIAGLQTSATFEQLAQAFQVAVGTGLSQGLTLDEIRKQVIAITQAAAAMNLPFNQLNQEVRDILQGTIDNNSQVAKGLNISTAMITQWKAQGQLVTELNKRLQPFVDSGKRLQETFAVAKANMGEALQALAALATSGLFEQLRLGFQDATKGLFDFDTAGISTQIEPLVSAFQNGFRAIGETLRNVMVGIRDVALATSKWIGDNKPEIAALSSSIGMLGEQLVGAVSSVVGIAVAFAKWLVESKAISFTLRVIAISIAGLRDGLTLLGAIFSIIGGGILLTVAKIQRGLAWVTSFISDDLAASYDAAASSTEKMGGAAVDAGLEIVAAMGRGESAVGDLEKAMKKAESGIDEIASAETFKGFTAAIAEFVETGKLSAETMQQLGIDATSTASAIGKLEQAATKARNSQLLGAKDYQTVLESLASKIVVTKNEEIELQAIMSKFNVTPLNEASEEVQKLTRLFIDLREKGTSSLAQIEAAGAKLIDSAKTETDMKVIKAAMGEVTQEAGKLKVEIRDGLRFESVTVRSQKFSKEMVTQLEDLGRKMRSLGPSLEGSLGQSLERMGAKTKDQLGAIAEQARVDFTRAFSTLNFTEQEKAFNNLAQASADTNNGIVSDFIRSEASARGFMLTVRDATLDFQRIVTLATTFSEQIYEAFSQSVSTAGTVAQLEALRAKLEQLAGQGKIVGGELSAAMDEVSAKLREVAAEPISALSNSFARLGISSKTQLQAVADQAQIDFDRIKNSGNVTTAELETAFIKYAMTVIAANNGIVPSFLKVRAAALGLTDTLDKLSEKEKADYEERKQMVAGIAGVITAIIQGVEQLSTKAFNSFAALTGMAGKITSELDGLVAGLRAVNLEMAHNAQHVAPSSISALIAFNDTANLVKRTFFEQAIAANKMGTALAAATISGGADLARLAKNSDYTLSRFTLLDDAQLDGLRSQVQAAKERVVELHNAILGTISSIRSMGDTLQEELLRAQGNLVAIERMRAEAAKRELDAKLRQVTTDPNATGADKAAAQAEYNRTLGLLNQVNAIKMANAKQEEIDNKARQLADHTQKLADIAAEKQAKLDANIAIANASLLSKAQPAGATPAAMADISQDIAQSGIGGTGGVTANFNLDGASLLSPEVIRRTVIPQLQQLSWSTR